MRKSIKVCKPAENEDVAFSPVCNSYNTINGSYNIIGNGNTVIIENNLSQQETALLDLFHKLGVIEQARLLAFAADLAKKEEGTEQ